MADFAEWMEKSKIEGEQQVELELIKSLKQ
jgi:hypothetical protein